MSYNFLQQVKRDVHQITTTDFGQDITITPLLGGPVVLSGYVSKHSITVDENGFIKVNTTSAHITVTETSLLNAGISTRDTNGGLITFAGYLVGWTDVSGRSVTYVVQKGGSKPNETTGQISFILGNWLSPNPPRFIYGWKPYAIAANIVTTPDPYNTQVLGNGDVIPREYSLNQDGTLTIPYLISIAGIQVLTPLLVNDDEYQDIALIYTNGTFNVSTVRGGFEPNVDKAYFNASLPIWSL